MTASPATAGTGALARATPWTCPYCPLLCDGFGMAVGADGTLALSGSDCPRAKAALAPWRAGPAAAKCRVDGQACERPEAVQRAVQLLRQSRQPLIAGLGADVAGARALYALAHDTGAIADAAAGPAFAQGLRVLQDRGAFTTTLAEVRNRADVIVCIGGSPAERQPEFWRRCGLGEDLVAARHVVILGGTAADTAALQGLAGVTSEVMALSGDLFDTVAALALAVAGRPAAPPIRALAERLQAARYAVLAWEAARLPAQGALVVEAVNRIVGLLNRRTRAAALPLGGGDGAATSNQVFTWLSGLPLRSKRGTAGLEHEPLAFDTHRLLADASVDLLLWVNSFGAAPPATAPGLPRILIGPPSLEAQAAGPGTVYLPVATPGIGAPGHLFRTDGVVLMPLHAVIDDGLPTLAAVVQQLHQGLQR